MLKFTLVVRGGVPEKMRHDIEEIISDINEQDNFFVSDIKTHSIEMVMFHDQIGPLVNRIQGAFNLSILKTDFLAGSRENVVMVLGKLQDSRVCKDVEEQDRKLL